MQADAQERYEVPELVIDPPDGLTATWHPNVKAVTIVTASGQDITLSAGEIRAVFQWVQLHELV